VLSVTSIRKLCGEPYNLVNWQLANIADAALGTMKRVVVGPRGGISEKRIVDEYPSEFVTRYDATEGKQSEIDDLRRWLRETADTPRNVAAARGTIVHEAIERNIQWDKIERPYVEQAFLELGSRDRKALSKRGVQDEDVHFVRNGVRQYWDMRRDVPFMILAREVQVFNLTAGYAGSFDALVWLLGEYDAEGVFHPIDRTNLPPANEVTIEDILKFGGTLVLVDWKTSKDVYTDQVVQAHAYLSAEFVGSNGVKDHRLTDLLHAAEKGALVHIRPDGWGFHMFDWEPTVVRAFLGSVAFARFLATYPKPTALFTHEFRGSSAETDEEIEAA
jgi:hypothetical protein